MVFVSQTHLLHFLPSFLTSSVSSALSLRILHSYGDGEVLPLHVPRWQQRHPHSVRADQRLHHRFCYFRQHPVPTELARRQSLATSISTRPVPNERSQEGLLRRQRVLHSRRLFQLDLSHSWQDWQAATANWEEHFELCETKDKGIGIFARTPFKKGAVLGWYAGVLVPNAYAPTWDDTDYALGLEIGSIIHAAGEPHPSISDSLSQFSTFPCNDQLEEDVTIDASRKGNWTRFVNHSCEPCTHFRLGRVGGVRIEVLQAQRDVEEGEEVTVCYGRGYWDARPWLRCVCGAGSCIHVQRMKEKVGGEEDFAGLDGEESMAGMRIAERDQEIYFPFVVSGMANAQMRGKCKVIGGIQLRFRGCL